LAVAAAAWPARTRRSIAPPIRGAASAVFAIALIAIYAAVNRYSVEQRAVEAMARGGTSASAPAPAALLILSSVATAVLPLALMAWGLRRRQTLVLDLGIVFAALSLVTLRYYIHISPLWVLLTGGGAVLVLGALRIGRVLRDAPGSELRGFTARPLSERKR